MEVQETRYPFDSVVDFWTGGYALTFAGMHLLIASVLLVGGVGFCLRMRDQSGVRMLSFLYFALQPFNNPAFSVAGVSIADVAGTLVAAAAVARLLALGLWTNRFTLGLILFVGMATLHAVIIWTIETQFLEQAGLVARLVIIAKVATLALVFMWIHSTQAIERYLPDLVAVIANFAMVICLIYVVQLAVFFSGGLPFGTFSGAGFSTTVAFGGVSIERGHLSKLMAPLFVPLAIHCFITKRYWKLGPYLSIMLLNFSASGLSFLAVQFAIGSLLFWRQLKPFVFSIAGIAVASVTAVTIYFFSEAYGAIIGKIYQLVFLGDESEGGGRSVQLLFDYLQRYPFGIGYSGSSFRTAPGLSEINMGLYAFVTQLSALSLIFVWILVATLVALSAIHLHGSIVARLLLLGALALPLVFATDIVWFVPLWWLPTFVLASYRRTMINLTDRDWRLLAAGAQRPVTLALSQRA